MGISAAVSVKWLMVLIFSISVASLGLYIINLLAKAFSGKPFFITSFSEGNALSTLTVVADRAIGLLEDDTSLISKVSLPSNISYTLASNDFEKLHKIEKSFAENDIILSIHLNR